MIIDLLAKNGNFNIKFAQVAGLNTAVYFAALTEVLEKVSEKKTYDSEGYWTLNRSYIEKRTTLTKTQQAECDEVLSKLGIMDISKDDNKKVRIRMQTFVDLVINNNSTEIAEISKVAKSATKVGKAEGKKAGIINRLQSRIKEVDTSVLFLYFDYIEVLYNQGVQTNAQIDLIQQTLNNFTTDTNTKIEILQIAIACGYRNIEWAIEMFNKKKKSNVGTRIGVEQKIATNVDKTIKF